MFWLDHVSTKHSAPAAHRISNTCRDIDGHGNACTSVLPSSMFTVRLAATRSTTAGRLAYEMVFESSGRVADSRKTSKRESGRIDDDAPRSSVVFGAGRSRTRWQDSIPKSVARNWTRVCVYAGDGNERRCQHRTSASNEIRIVGRF